jgi:uncharacterized membrane protein
VQKFSLDVGQPPAATPPQSHVPAWLRPTGGEHRWPAALAVVAVIAVQLMVPAKLAIQPRWLLPGVELLLLVVLAIADPGRVNRESRALRLLGLVLVSVTSLTTAYAAARLVGDIAAGNGNETGIQLLISGAEVWLTNVIVFALWCWELDLGGPAARAHARRLHPSFLFTQMTSPHLAPKDWEPSFVDYLYLSFTNATAFSPTDTMPLNRRAKLAMMFQAMVSFCTVLLVIARAVNIFH